MPLVTGEAPHADTLRVLGVVCDEVNFDRLDHRVEKTNQQNSARRTFGKHFIRRAELIQPRQQLGIAFSEGARSPFADATLYDRDSAGGRVPLSNVGCTGGGKILGEPRLAGRALCRRGINKEQLGLCSSFHRVSVLYRHDAPPTNATPNVWSR